MIIVLRGKVVQQFYNKSSEKKPLMYYYHFSTK